MTGAAPSHAQPSGGSFWIGVAHRAQALAARTGGFCAFSHGSRTAAERVTVGDGVIYYAPRADFDGAPVHAFVALAWITGEVADERPMPGTDFRPWARSARFEDVAEAPVRPLLPKLGFVRTPRHWGIAFRRSLFAVERADFDLIAEAMRRPA